jgi:eukaryotic-like serine/threonine-protein kinase
MRARPNGARAGRHYNCRVNPGEIIGGKYRIERLLGQGGVALVFEATHLDLGHQVAVKRLRPEAMARREPVQRFLREARASAKLRGEHAARVFDVGTFGDAGPYIVMELLRGRDLAAVVAPGPLDPGTAAEYLLQVCEAVAEAHGLGIIHRDLKPANLFLTQATNGRDLVKVLDFGISKARPKLEGDFSLTRTASLVGSPRYMSPEQLRSPRDVDERSDVWSLGVTLHELCEGRVPFDAELFSDLCIKVAMDPIPPLVLTPPALAAVIERCLAKDPLWRWPNVAELAAALAPFGATDAPARVERIQRLLHGQRTPPSQPATPRPGTFDREAGNTPAPYPPRRRRLPVVALGGATIAATFVLIGLMFGGRAGKTAPPAVAAPANPVVVPLPTLPAPVIAPDAGPAVSPAAAEAPPTPRPAQRSRKPPAPDIYDSRN